MAIIWRIWLLPSSTSLASVTYDGFLLCGSSLITAVCRSCCYPRDSEGRKVSVVLQRGLPPHCPYPQWVKSKLSFSSERYIWLFCCIVIVDAVLLQLKGTVADVQKLGRGEVTSRSSPTRPIVSSVPDVGKVQAQLFQRALHMTVLLYRHCRRSLTSVERNCRWRPEAGKGRGHFEVLSDTSYRVVRTRSG